MAKQRDKMAIKADLMAHGEEAEAPMDFEDFPFEDPENIQDFDDDFTPEDLDRLHGKVMAAINSLGHPFVYNDVVRQHGFDPLAA